MALIVKEKQDKKITISGTDITLAQIYVRLEFAGRADGKTLEVSMTSFASKETFLEGKMLFTDVPQGNITVEILPTEVQSVDTAHEYAKQAYVQMGYDVEIDLS
jgi:hypothetical protein